MTPEQAALRLEQLSAIKRESARVEVLRIFADEHLTSADACEQGAAALRTHTALVTALRGLLAYEAEAAEFRGLKGCTCISHSRDAERHYETGQCPHQHARKALADLDRATGGTNAG